jgi:hypothetical protein
MGVLRAVEDLVAVRPETEACVVLEAHPHPGRTRCERRNEDGRERGGHGETDETIHEIWSPLRFSRIADDRPDYRSPVTRL